MPIYEVRYERDDNEGPKKWAHLPGGYSAGEYRTLLCNVSSEKEARALAEERLAEQFPDDMKVNGVDRPDLAHSAYMFAGITKTSG